MGVPKFFGYLMKKYKDAKFIFQEKIENIDWFLIDANSLMHPIAFKILAEEQEKEKINFKSLENKMMNAIIEYINKLVKYVEAHNVYIAVDGPVAMAKMKQQRQRRFKSAHDKMLFDKIKKKYNKKISYFWSNSAISPGTKFMEKLNKKIIAWCQTQNFKILYSSANVPGEGEHKLLQFIRENQTKNLNLSYTTYGLDADLIFLMLSTGLKNIYLLREASQFDNKLSDDQLNYVSIEIMKDCIYKSFKELGNKIDFKKDRITNDFIFLCYFLGNDFLPHLPSLDIAKNAIDYLLKKYVDIYVTELDYLLNEDKSINQTFFNKFLQILGKEEKDILVKNFNKKKYSPNCESSDPYDIEMHKIEYLKFKIDNPIGLGSDPNYRVNYYKHYFDVSDEEMENYIEKLVKAYLEGLRWVSYYYFDTNPNWNWYYPYNNPPLLCDISKYIINMNSITFIPDEPVSPIEQLLIILPPNSNFLLPTIFSKVVVNPKSSIAYLYPNDFIFDFLYKNRYYEGIPLLPEIELDSVKHIFFKYKDELTVDEINRNKRDKLHIYNGSI
jgi:5'-3' exonuclease